MKKLMRSLGFLVALTVGCGGAEDLHFGRGGSGGSGGENTGGSGGSTNVGGSGGENTGGSGGSTNVGGNGGSTNVGGGPVCDAPIDQENCVSGTWSDGETDIDCGGTCAVDFASLCVEGQHCLTEDDCEVGLVCVLPGNACSYGICSL